jgi:hypothetical protein
MTLEAFRDHCMRKPGFSEDLPFDDRTLAFRVGGKIFALMDVEEFNSVSHCCPVKNRTKSTGSEGWVVNPPRWTSEKLAGWAFSRRA